MKKLRFDIEKDGFYGTYWSCKEGSDCGVIAVLGDDPEDHMARAAVKWLHTLRLNVLTMSPEKKACGYHNYPLEYVEKAIQWLKSHHNRKIGILGASTTGTMALTAASFFPDITLTIVGSGSEEANLRELCNTLDISECVHFTGRLSNKDTLAEMAAAEIFIMPSYPEGLGIVYLEAMASGCVVIGTQGEGISGVVSHGESGFLVPRDDIDTIVQWVDRCFRDPPLMQRVACAGKSIARSLTWDHNAEQYVKLFKELCS